MDENFHQFINLDYDILFTTFSIFQFFDGNFRQ